MPDHKPMRFYNPAFLGWWFQWSFRCARFFWQECKNLRRHPPMKPCGTLEIDIGEKEIVYFPFRGKLMEAALKDMCRSDVKPLFGGVKPGETPAI